MSENKRPTICPDCDVELKPGALTAYKTPNVICTFQRRERWPLAQCPIDAIVCPESGRIWIYAKLFGGSSKKPGAD